LNSPDCDYKDYGENYHSQVGAPEGGKTWEDALEENQYQHNRLAGPPDSGEAHLDASNSTNTTTPLAVLRAPMAWHVCQNDGMLTTLRGIDKLQDFGLSIDDFIARFVSMAIDTFCSDTCL
jgi:hypothetical protein